MAKRNNKIKIILIVVIIAIVLITGGSMMYLNGIGAVDSGNKETVTVDIPEGSGASYIVQILDEQGLVKNTTFAKIHARIGGYDSLQANSYMFSKSMTLPEMFEAINTGDFNYISKEKFTIIEGASIPQAAEAIAAEMPFTADEIIKKWSDRDYLESLIKKYWFLTDDIMNKEIMYPLEGYIYPETYFVTTEAPSIEEITTSILDKTDEELTARKAEISASGRTIHEFLTLASIVENESLFEKDRPMIAGVFINRLDKDMPLQSDITVLYALQEKRVDVTYDDLEVESKYNTYKNTGLPVGPVCAVPGRTMDDVLNYEKSDYLYFFATEDGKVLYSKTVEEHNKLVKDNMWY
ncbi:MAG: endolytic transglycosylase MltG [Bacillota bacterium]|nr:endolytic transglycosylase MltG [Bacillota bacterium]